MPSAASAKDLEFPNPKKMSERKSHIDDNFIPDGLEFREEYMHTALGKYRRKKRAILWGKIGAVAAILIASSVVSIALWNKPVYNPQAEESSLNSIIEKNKIATDSSSTLDLDNDEGTFNRNRQSPAVESSKATQDLSNKAVDKGDPMSSGVGLPGQLSTSESKVHTRANNRNRQVVEAVKNEVIIEQAKQEPINYQLSSSTLEENKGIEDLSQPTNIAFISFESFPFNRTLAHHRPLPALPVSKWSVYASVGAKLWADYGFGSGPAKVDPIVGIGIDYKWRKKMSLRVAGQFFTVSGIAAPYVSTQRTYAEGFSETTFSYHTDKFYHTGISAGIAYRMNNKHSLGMLFDSNVLLTANNRIETGSASSFEARTSNEVNARGYVQGFRKIQHSIGLSYEYALGKNKSIGMAYRFGLTDVTINSYFGNSSNRNSMLSLYFTIKLKP
jgi:hypothetical protein